MKEKLKTNLQKDIHNLERKLSDSELIDIVEKIGAIPKKEKTKTKINSIVESVLDVKSVILSDLSVDMLISDNSDIDYLLDQINNTLKKDKKDE